MIRDPRKLVRICMLIIRYDDKNTNKYSNGREFTHFSILYSTLVDNNILNIVLLNEKESSGKKILKNQKGSLIALCNEVPLVETELLTHKCDLVTFP